jgi:hypothetical protein
MTPEELAKYVADFEKEAKRLIGKDLRSQFRKPEPKKPIAQRVQEAKEHYERIEKQK